MILSFTKLQRSDCPFLYNQIYNLKNEPPTGPPLEFGKLIHTIFQWHVTEVISGKTPDKDAIIEKLVPAIMYDRIEEIEEVYDLFIRRVRLNIDTIIGVEESINIGKDGEDLDFQDKTGIYRGFIDIAMIMEKAGEIWDWKTNRKIDSHTDVDLDRQLTGYAWLLKTRYPFLEYPIEVGKYFARYGAFRKSVRTEEDIKNFRRYVLKRIEAINSWDEFEPVVCDQCKYCQVATTICPLATQEVDVVEVIDDESAEEAIAKIHILSRVLSDMKDNLKEYVQINDLESVGGLIKYGFRDVTSTVYPVGDTIDLAAEYDINIDDILKVNNTNLKKVLKKSGKEVKAVFDKIQEHKISTRFKQITS